MRKRFLSLLLVLACVLTLAVVPVIAAEPDPVQPSAPTTEPSAPATEPTVPTAPSIYAQQGKCRNHAAFSTLKTIKHPL